MKYKINQTTLFKKELKKIKKQNKDLKKLEYVINTLANKNTLEEKYKDHQLVDDKNFKNCRECHNQTGY